MLVSVPANKQIAILKALREVKPGLGLAEAMELVETLPSTVFDGISETVKGSVGENVMFLRDVIRSRKRPVAG